MEGILSLLNYGLILFFGTLLSIDFSGVEKIKKNRIATSLLLIVLLLTQILSRFLLGLDCTIKIYPFIVHFPIVLTLIIYFKRDWLMAFISVFSAYLCCQIPRWFSMVTLSIIGIPSVNLIVYTLCVFPTLYLLERHAVFPALQLMKQSRRSQLLFGAVPFLYYVFDYTATVYTNVLYDGLAIAVQFIPSTVSLLYFVYITLYYSEQQHRNNAETNALLMRCQVEEAGNQIAQLYLSQEQAAIYRHDMRHHFSLVRSFLTSGEIDQAQAYIKQALTDIEAITPIRYCENNTVNLILSSFAGKAQAKNVRLLPEVKLPHHLSISETEVCAILSNTLENAIKAAALVEKDSLRNVYLSCKISEHKLLIYMKNNYIGTVVLENDLPKAEQKGHGFGTKSIASIVKKYDGYYGCEATNGIFILRIVLPMVC